MAHRHEVIVVGAGGAGLTAALYAAKEGADVAVVSKLYPTRSHTGAGRGAFGAAPGSGEWSDSGRASCRASECMGV